MSQTIGVLTSGGDCPGLNAALRGVGKAGLDFFDMEIVGFRDGFPGLVRDRTQRVDAGLLSGILTDGGTILGTSLGHVQRGGTPSAADRLLATRLGTACAQLLSEQVYGVMVAARGDGVEPVELEKVAGNKKLVPPDHPWVQSARLVGTSLGD